MDVSEKLLESYRWMSRASVILLNAILFLCAYELFHSVTILIYTDSPKQFSRPAIVEIDPGLLALSFKTYVLLWPVLLGASCLAFCSLAFKCLLTYGQLPDEAKKLPWQIGLRPEPLLLGIRGLNHHKNFAWHCVSIIPLVTLIMHLVSLCSVSGFWMRTFLIRIRFYPLQEVLWGLSVYSSPFFFALFGAVRYYQSVKDFRKMP